MSQQNKPETNKKQKKKNAWKLVITHSIVKFPDCMIHQRKEHNSVQIINNVLNTLNIWLFSFYDYTVNNKYWGIWERLSPKLALVYHCILIIYVIEFIMEVVISS